MPTQPFMSVEQLTALGRSTVLNTVPEQSRQSLPIPVVGASGHVQVAFFFCPSLVTPREGARMTPPHFLVFLDPDTGRMLELKSVTPGDFGRSDPPGEVLGAFRLPDGMTFQDYLERRSRLFALYDLLLPEFAASTPPASSSNRAAAREFRSLFTLLREPPVAAYYDAAGSRFFGWVRGVAEQ